VSRIDPKTNKVAATIEVGVPGSGGDIAVGEGSVWVTAFEYPLSRIDPSANTVVQQFYGPGGDAVRVGLGSVWLSNYKQGNVWRIDPRRVEATLPN
jgi:DNA-binding beta-propeller fold protein YncE